MKILLIGGTGTISTAITHLLVKKEHEVTVLNRGNKNQSLPRQVKTIQADCKNELDMLEKIGNKMFDAAVDFIAFEPEQVQRDYRIFEGKIKQYLFISSASAYHKPMKDYRITEGTSLANPYWEYARKKIACEEYLMRMYREHQFPVTIVRPSHTYGEKSVPTGVHGAKGSYQVIKRMQEGKKVIIHGDGTSLWTMTHSRDFAKAFVGLLGNLHAMGEAVQITNDETLTWNQIYQCIADALGVELKPYYVASEFLAQCSYLDLRGSLLGDKANSVVFENQKLKRLVPGFAPEIRFEEGIKEAVSYVLSHKECQVEDEAFDQWCDKVIKTLECAGELIRSDA